MNKVNINVTKQEKIDNRVNNTGRPVNKKSARQVRLAKQTYLLFITNCKYIWLYECLFVYITANYY